MGARMPASPRILTMRSSSTRTIFIAVAILVLLAITFRTESIDVRDRLLHHEAPQKHASAVKQEPLDAPAPPKAVVDSPPVSTHVMNCNIDSAHMKQLKETYKLEDKVQYLKRYVKFTRKPIMRKSYTRLDQTFLPKKFKTIDISKDYNSEECIAPLEVPVTQSPFPSRANASDFMFAVSTTYKRFTEEATSPIKEWSFWLTDSMGHSNGGKLLLLLLDASDEELSHARQVLSEVGIDADVYHSDASMEMAARYLTLVPTLYNHPERKNKKWLVTCDDDTFFPSINGLIEKFQQFDHESPLYIGTLSEDVNGVDRHGSQAFGGAGVFLSVPLAAKVAKVYDDCKTEEKVKESNSGWGPQGDILLRKCIYEHTEVRLTNVWDLWQLDLYGDPSGFYEGGIKPLSLHHFKGGGWHFARPFEYTKIAHGCGEDCTFQRFITNDDFILSNGYSVSHYPKGIDFNLDQFEGTFHAAPDDKGWNLDYMMGPQRLSLLQTGRKIGWDLVESQPNVDGSILQTYVRKHDDWRWVDADKVPMSKIDGVIELVWIPA